MIPEDERAELADLDRFTARRLAREIGGEITSVNNRTWVVTKSGNAVRVFREKDEITLQWNTRRRKRRPSRQ